MEVRRDDPAKVWEFAYLKLVISGRVAFGWREPFKGDAGPVCYASILRIDRTRWLGRHG
jgi:hypothetical protein